MKKNTFFVDAEFSISFYKKKVHFENYNLINPFFKIDIGGNYYYIPWFSITSSLLDPFQGTKLQNFDNLNHLTSPLDH